MIFIFPHSNNKRLIYLGCLKGSDSLTLFKCFLFQVKLERATRHLKAPDAKPGPLLIREAELLLGPKVLNTFLTD